MPIPSQLYINIAKYKFANDAAEASKLAADICGGIISCAPNYRDWNNPKMRTIFDKYLAAASGISTEHRLRAVRLLKDLTAFNNDQTQIHAEGSLMAQKMMLYAGGDWERYKAAAKRAAGIPGWETHPVFKDLVEFEPDKVLKGLKFQSHLSRHCKRVYMVTIHIKRDCRLRNIVYSSSALRTELVSFC